MKNLDENMEFENQFRSVFENAESEPDERVWNSINTRLAEKENGVFRRKVVYWQWVAAASVLIAVAIGVISILNPPLNNSSENIARNNTSVEAEEGNSDFSGSSEKSRQESVQTEFSEKSDQAEQIAQNLMPSGSAAESAVASIEEQGITSADNFSKNQNEIADLPPASSNNAKLVDKENLPVITGLNQEESDENRVSYGNGQVDMLAYLDVKSLETLISTEKPEHKRLYKVPEVWRMKEKKKQTEENDVLWAGVNFSSGLFDPNFSQPLEASSFSTANSLIANSMDKSAWTNNQPVEEKSNPGVSFSTGINMGLKITPKLVLQTGIQYAMNNSSSSTSLVVESAGFSTTSNQRVPVHVSNYDYQAFRMSSTQVESVPVDVSNSFEFVSVPVQAGYVLFGNKFQVIMNGGISTEFFLRNQLKADDSGFRNVNVAAGNDAPYRSVSFNGLIGTTLSYRLNENYQITLDPGLRVSLSNFARDNYYFESHPRAFTVGLGMRYNFK
jgi:hypothetical protein